MLNYYKITAANDDTISDVAVIPFLTFYVSYHIPRIDSNPGFEDTLSIGAIAKS